MESTWTPVGLQVDSRKFSSNMTIFVESWWTPAGVHQIHQDYLESTWSMWSKVKYCVLQFLDIEAQVSDAETDDQNDSDEGVQCRF